uniref:Odorant receptor n=1 Tax=Caenorhabditis tropicalis TaxID=1561998 RepID=A0A1I7T8Z1_9PELO
MMLRYNFVIRDQPIMPFMPYDPTDESVRWLNVLYTIVMTSVMAFQYSVMLYCGCNMFFKMEEKISNFSVTLKHHHRQLFKTLVLQVEKRDSQLTKMIL